jgi:hypothetical protein
MPLTRLARLAAHPLARHLAAVALWAMLAVQAIGLVHGIAHPKAQAALVSAIGSPAPAAAAGDAHDEGSAQCRLLDQLAQAVALVAPPPLAALPAPAAQRAAPAFGVARSAGAWSPPARGPPTSLA